VVPVPPKIARCTVLPLDLVKVARPPAGTGHWRGRVTVTFLTDRLEQRGLITRKVPASNRRIKVIVLTPLGVQARARLVQTLAASSPLARLSATEQQRLFALLAKAGADPAQFTCQTASSG